MKHPNLEWEVRSMDGRLVSCLLAPCALAHAVVQYVDEMVSTVEEFDDLNAARERVWVLFVDTARRTPDGSAGNVFHGPRRRATPAIT